MVQQLQTVLTAPPRSRREVQRLTCCLGRAVETAAWLNTNKEPCLSFPVSASWLLFVLPSPAIAPWGESQDRHRASGTVVLSHSHFTPPNFSNCGNAAWPLDITVSVHPVLQMPLHEGIKSISEMVMCIVFSSLK